MGIIRIPPPLGGVFEGLDPALPDEIYRPTWSPDLENVRVAGGAWETRLGMVLWKTLSGTGPGRFFFTHYTSAGKRLRLAARGNGEAAVLYDYDVDGLHAADSSFQSVTNGTGLGNVQGDAFQAVSLAGYAYLTDRENGLRRYDPSVNPGLLTTVAQPAAPTEAPRVKPVTYRMLEDWTGDSSGEDERFGWSHTDLDRFNLNTSSTASPANFTSGSFGVDPNRWRIAIANSGAASETITENVTDEPIPSKTIAFWVHQDTRNGLIAFEIGLTEPGQFQEIIAPPKANASYPIFVRIGNIGTIQFKRFRCLSQPNDARTCHLSRIILPGNLEGKYRWRYTHYSPSAERESRPSAVSNNGRFSDFSKLGVSYRTDTAQSADGAMLKAAALDFKSDSDVDSTTTQIRIYRNGGVPELTKDSRGQDVWVRVGTILDFETTLSAAVDSGDRQVSLEAVGVGAQFLGAGDWVVFDKGVTSQEEYAQIVDDYAYSDLAIDSEESSQVTSASRPFTNADLGKALSIISGSGFNVGDFSISAVTGTKATLSGVAGDVESTGGSAILSGVDKDAKKVTFRSALVNPHSNGAYVQATFVDNIPDEALDSSTRLDAERHDPPAGVRYVDRAPDGRLWLFGWTARPLGVAVSSKSTADREMDHEVFPSDVDPLTRGSLIQGWRFDLSGDASGDQIVWGGFFRGNATILTRKGLYQVFAGSQADWGPTSVVKMLDVGCIAGDAVRIVNDTLYWPAPGPRVMRWDGQGPPQDISFQRVNVTLNNAPPEFWSRWWAQGHADRRGAYYRLWMVPAIVSSFNNLAIHASDSSRVSSGGGGFTAADVGRVLYLGGGTGFTRGYYTIASVTSGAAILDRAAGTPGSTGGTGLLADAPTRRLDYNIVQDAWEPVVYYDGAGIPIPFTTGAVLDGQNDAGELYALGAAEGGIHQQETGLKDGANSIRVRAVTKRFDLGGLVARVESFWLRLAGVSDNTTFSVKTGGSQYGDVTYTTEPAFSILGTGDLETKRRLPFNQKGRWVQLTFSGSFNNRPVLRELVAWFSGIRSGKVE